jgi:site-specific DNA-cytosine methylase
MSRIRGKDSASEMRLRRLIHGLGYRYRLHVRSLPGTPDLVFPARRAIIFMHGCFWHRHQGCRLAIFQDGAKVYPGHTGSPLDLPAKTLKAGGHGVPGGENMMVLENGDVRYFSVRESARLQTFPDGYVFHGSWTETMRQLGNAVPVTLGRQVAASVALRLAESGLLKLANRRGRRRA